MILTSKYPFLLLSSKSPMVLLGACRIKPTIQKWASASTITLGGGLVSHTCLTKANDVNKVAHLIFVYPLTSITINTKLQTHADSNQTELPAYFKRLFRRTLQRNTSKKGMLYVIRCDFSIDPKSPKGTDLNIF